MPSRLLALLILLLAIASGASAETSPLLEAGIPASNREWTGDDYVLTAKILEEGKVPLPRLNTEPGRQFIERLTSRQNLAFCRDQALPIQQRLGTLLSLMSGSSTIMKLYTAEANKGVEVHRELVLQMEFILRVAALSVQTVDEFIPTVPKDDRYPARMAGLERMHRGLTTVFGGAETSLSETSFYPPDDLSLLLGAMTENLPVLKKAFADDYKIEVRKKLEAHRAHFPRPADAKNIERMLAELGS